MSDELASQVGARLRRARLSKRKSQTVIAGLAGITTDYLYQIERGLKLPTLPVLKALSSAVGVPLAELLDESAKRHVTSNDMAASLGDALYTAMTQPVAAEIDNPLSVSALHHDIHHAWRTWQSSQQRYSRLGALVPELLTTVEAACLAAQSAPSEDRRATWQAAADCYGLMRTFGKRAGRLDLALLAADRALRATRAADDPIRLAAAYWNMAHVLLADGQLDGAEELAMQAAEGLARRLGDGENHDDLAAVRGSLLLVGAMAAAQQGDVWSARARVDEAASIAARTGEWNACWTAFGPTNVAIHAVSVEVEAGETAEGRRLGERCAYQRSPSIERRIAFLIDQARGYVARRAYGDALAVMLAAEREAVEDVRYRPASAHLLNTLIQRGRSTVACQAALLAQRVGLPQLA